MERSARGGLELPTLSIAAGIEEEYEDTEVGVELWLRAPGDSVYLVDGLLSDADAG